MRKQKWIENRILQLLEKHGFLSAKQIVQRMPGIDLKVIDSTLEILGRHQFLGTLVNSNRITLYFFEEEE